MHSVCANSIHDDDNYKMNTTLGQRSTVRSFGQAIA